MKARILPGSPEPLGASWDGSGVNFALFSQHATRVELCLFDPTGSEEIERVDLAQKTGDIWHGYMPGAKVGTVYGYRVHGPYQPTLGHRFNHHKLLLDPYARQIAGSLNWTDSVFGYKPADDKADLSFDTRDSAGSVPKAVVVDESFDWGDDKPPAIPWSDTLIYEAHVRGQTRLHPQVDSAKRGVLSGLATPALISHMKTLGVTAIELQPVHAFVDDHFLVKKDLVNYWGYNTLGFFALESRYLAGGDRNEFKAMVKDMHEAGIEVILDVVYNHTAEGDQSGPTLSFRGIDNTSYYRLPNDNKRYYINDTGCGNTLNVNHPQVLQMVIDSLRHWVIDMHVDGFRFDLAVTLGREAYGFDVNGAFFSAIHQDPVLSQVKLIAEPWDIGPGGYQLGNFPPAWAEWNDRYRDSLRRFWRGDSDQLRDFARSLLGSSDLFEHNDRTSSASINFITSHDGFTLTDLVSYNERHNEANLEDNRDGHHANFSSNYGVEGATSNPIILAQRERQRRNLLATMFLSQGTPMLLAGDEMNRSQMGNNNAYCQDNSINWLHWSVLENEAGFLDFVQRLSRLRNSYALLRRERFVHGEEINEITEFADIQWYRENGEPMHDNDWHDHKRHFLSMLLVGSDNLDGVKPDQQETITPLFIAFNAETIPLTLTLPGSYNDWYNIFTSGDSMVKNTVISKKIMEPRSIDVFELRAL